MSNQAPGHGLALERALLWALTVFLISTMLGIALREYRWQNFVIEHKCEPAVGQQIGGMKGWLCDDGITYWR